MRVFDDIRELKSRQKYSEAWVVGFSALQEEMNNEYLKTALFWVAYAALKDITSEVRSREPMQPRAQEQEVIDGWVNSIADLRLDLPNENIDFRLWNLFKGIGHHCGPLCNYVLSSGRSIFHDQDHEPFVTDKGESPSLVARVARTVAQHYLLHRKSSGLPAPRVVALLEYALTAAKDGSGGKTWLEYDRAKIFLSCGEFERARQAYLVVLKKKMTESWAWFGLAQTYPEDNDKAIKLIAKGLISANEDKFAIRGYVLLAQLSSESSAYELSSKALVKVHRIYEANGWQLKDRVVEMMASAWFDGSVDIVRLDEELAALAEGADELAANRPVTVNGVVERVHRSGKGAEIYVDRKLQLRAKKQMFLTGSLPDCGAAVSVTFDAGSDDNTVISVDEAPAFEADDVRCFHGVIKVTEKGFGFVSDEIFVPPMLIDGVTTNENVSGVAVMQYDQKKNRYGWKAVSLKLEDVTV